MLSVKRYLKYGAVTFAFAASAFITTKVLAAPSHDYSWFEGQLKSGIQYSIEDGSATSTYNCLAYALGVTSTWIWPWGSSDATLSEITKVLTDQGYNTRSPGPSYIPPRLVVYGSSNAIGHIAKITNSNPQTTKSKWGPWELVETKSYDPYRPTPNGYGPAIQYYW